MYSQTIAPNSSGVNQKKTKQIIVYGSDSCHYCTDTKKFLKKNGVSFIYYDVDQNQSKLNEMITKLLKRILLNAYIKMEMKTLVNICIKINLEKNN